MWVVIGGSNAASLIEVAAYWWKGFSTLRRYVFPITRRKLRTVVREMGTSGFAVGGKAKIAAL